MWFFIDWEEHDDDIIIPLKDIENFKQYYEWFILKDSFQCKMCLEVFVDEGSSYKKYCDKCKKERKKKYNDKRRKTTL